MVHKKSCIRLLKFYDNIIGDDIYIDYGRKGDYTVGGGSVCRNDFAISQEVTLNLRGMMLRR